jgi:hypothetical protein
MAMERLLAKTSPTVLFGALSRAYGFVRDQVWLRGSLAGLGCAAIYISVENLWSAVLRHAGMTLLLSLPVVLVARLVVEAEKARQLFQPTRSCRRH